MEGREHAEMRTTNPYGNILFLKFMLNSSFRYIKRTFNFRCISWIKNNICFCKAAVFASGLVFSYKLAEKAIVNVFITFFTDFEPTHDLRKAVAFVNFQEALSALLGIVMVYISQACGHLKRIIFCLTVTYASGMMIFGLITTNTKAFRESIFDLVSIIGLILIAVSRAGLMLFVRGFTAEQFESHEPDKQNIMKERVKARSDMWWRFAWVAGSLVAIPLFNSSWTQRFGTSGLVMGITFVVFLLASPLYHKREAATTTSIAEKPKLFTCIRVVWAALSKSHTNRNEELELWPQVKSLRWIDKAGRRCSETEVQETKYILKMVPMWCAFLVFGLVLSSGNTFFAEQAIDLESADRFLIYLVLLQSITCATIPVLFSRLLSKWFPDNKLKQNMIRICAGMVISIICCAVTWRVEVYRLHKFFKYVQFSDYTDHKQMSIWWLAPQYFLLGLMDGLGTDGLQHFTNDDDHLSRSMKTSLSAINIFVVNSIGSALNLLCIYPNTKHFSLTLNSSHLDLYYKYLTLGATLNCVYLLLISIFIYRCSDTTQVNEESIVIYRGSDTAQVNEESIVIYRGSDTAQVNEEQISETTSPDASISFNEESTNEESM